MSTGKRLAKRSILGSRVCAPTEEGIYMPGLIQATKTDCRNENIYTVSFLHNKGMTGEYRGEQLIGAGFKSVVSGPLKTGQKVYVTLNGREVCGVVDQHYQQHEQVLISVHSGGQLLQLVKRLDEVRLLESRKSARLQDVDVDYSRLAEGTAGKGLTVEITPAQLGIPRENGWSRKRRTSMSDNSDTRSDTMDDCMAALVLMRLSCSPKSARLLESDSAASSLTASAPLSSASSSFSTASSSLSSNSVSFESSPSFGQCYFDLELARRAEGPRTEYKCALCGVQFVTCETVRRHIRFAHLEDLSEDLGKEDEEQYYTEVQVDFADDDEHQAMSFKDDISLSGESTDDASSRPSSPAAPQPPHNSIFMSSAPTLSHLDMARPSHEDPELQSGLRKCPSSPINIPPHFRSQQKKLPTKIHMSPKHRSRGRSESRKCRKVYGMENRDQWCTQCKWKKACTRFLD
ncbi:zinc finger protein 395 [Galendromus occidentalis]|uniref:Zinc finger protein 395 n=1 Tax=Galendromus occidentalis TaxID=34638 RepID=A0AAJ7L7J2_9ACAR|nr:zinc finger protein 395 [Galendromus occidentalis]